MIRAIMCQHFSKRENLIKDYFAIQVHFINAFSRRKIFCEITQIHSTIHITHTSFKSILPIHGYMKIVYKDL